MTKPASLTMRVAALTHVGLRRTANEDTIAVGAIVRQEPMEDPWLSVHALDRACVCMVADGMGGHPAGDVASRIAVEHLCAELPAACADDAAILALLRATNRRLFDAMERHPQLYGMGTTLAGLVADERTLAAFNVGDSRIYRLHCGQIEQVSLDHSEEVPASFFFSQLPARMLSQCLGGYPDPDDIHPHLTRLPTTEGARFLICSDGLHDMLSDAAIAACITDDPSRSTRSLFEAAMDAGGLDNISIILAQVERATSDADIPDAPAGS